MTHPFYALLSFLELSIAFFWISEHKRGHKLKRKYSREEKKDIIVKKHDKKLLFTNKGLPLPTSKQNDVINSFWSYMFFEFNLDCEHKRLSRRSFERLDRDVYLAVFSFSPINKSDQSETRE